MSTNQPLFFHSSACSNKKQPEESKNLQPLSHWVAKCPVDGAPDFLLAGELGVGSRGHSLPPDFSPQA